ncbi:hypothetical protein ACFV1L_10190 [Kitasatospora sp. NPDC059646]|uniref:hypothetical protein n=1 Tax=Kitasatospora sp. NPDC059646 TaxID=3346893 RepID=UPI00369EF4EF
MTDPQGAHVELVDEDDGDGDGLMPTVVRVNGVAVGRLAEAPQVRMHDDGPTTVTLVLQPRRLDIRRASVHQPPAPRLPFGFKAS